MTIDSPDVERLADEVAQLTGESRAEAVRQALEERLSRLVHDALVGRGAPTAGARLREILERSVWPLVPPNTGRPWTQADEDALLGYGEHGV